MNGQPEQEPITSGPVFEAYKKTLRPFLAQRLRALYVDPNAPLTEDECKALARLIIWLMNRPETPGKQGADTANDNA